MTATVYKSQRVNHQALAASVARVALLLDEETGTCTRCGRPVRLIGLGLVPPHPSSIGPLCPGGEQPPAEWTAAR
jgi:hypothetical protein